MTSICVPSRFKWGKRRGDEEHFFRTWVHNLFFQRCNILSFCRFSSWLFIMFYTVLPVNALAGTPLCQYKTEEFQKFLEEIQISKLKFVLFVYQEEGCPAGYCFLPSLYIPWVYNQQTFLDRHSRIS